MPNLMKKYGIYVSHEDLEWIASLSYHWLNDDSQQEMREALEAARKDHDAGLECGCETEKDPGDWINKKDLPKPVVRTGQATDDRSQDDGGSARQTSEGGKA
jgi:hypothetical protein